MGQVASSALTQYDVEEVILYCGGVFNQQEIQSLYRRFLALDRGSKGYITADEFLSIPELSINPIAQRLVRLFHCVNFKEFCKLLSSFSDRAVKEQKIELIFTVYDVDGDGIITREDMQSMLRQIAGSSLAEEDLSTIIDEVLKQSGSPSGIDLATFKAIMKESDLTNMQVQVPVDW